MLGERGSKLLILGWFAFLGAFTFLAYTDFALFTNARWCGNADEHCLREWIGALSGWVAALAAGVTIFVLVDQLKAAQLAAAIARETLEITQRSAESQLRAYVFTEKPTIAKFAPFTIKVTIKNAGQTPAYRCRIEFSCTVGTAFDSANAKTHVHPGANLGPGQSSHLHFYAATEMVGEISAVDFSDDRTLWLFGVISYEDAFGKFRSTKFRHYLSVKKMEVGAGMSLAIAGNEAT